ncbi:hypothetical protein [Actinoplanes sp. NPDC049599]|uniref:hypothetical protein n=1 Tax=Actinoplanes sp. NPDC049599 TaxID=3363903 RepID=UPI0037B83903
MLADRDQARDTATARLLSGPRNSIPVTLLPVGLHTSWSGGTLRVRIQPDQISTTHHDPRLTSAETAAATAYWTTCGAGHADQAWVDLVRTVGPYRAAWIVRGSDPAQPTPQTRDGSWTGVAVRFELLPDRFAVVAYAAGQPVNTAPADSPPQYVTWGTPIDADALTITPWSGAGALDWTADFAAAQSAGMGVMVTVPPSAPTIDELVAVGVRTSGGSLADLLDEHAFTVGVELTTDQTATNNTDAARSTFSPEHDVEVAAALLTEAPTPPKGSGGAQFAELLGVDPSRLSRTAGASVSRVDLPSAVRLLTGLAADGPVSGAVGDPAAWALVTPGGPAPALRVGPQPYGVLPASVPARWTSAAGEAGAAVAPLLAAWAASHAAPVDVDPARTVADPPVARRVTADDESTLLDLLVESARSLSWSGDGYDYTGRDGLVGQAGTYLETIAATASANLTDVALPDVLLARIAVMAKRRATAEQASAVDAALSTLAAAARSEAGLDQLAAAVTTHLDALSHRTDAWITAVAAERLVASRSAGAGSALGAYGYVSDVAARTDDRSSGHVHAPSLGQAATAAVLRAGYLGQRQALETAGGGDGGTLAIDLSSRRIRAARWVLTAVRGGQALGAVLGYRFERDLADAGLSRYLSAFRKLTRFSTGSGLQRQEEARHRAASELAVAQRQLTILQQAATAAAHAAEAADAVLRAAVSAQAAADVVAEPYWQMMRELDTVTREIPALESALAAVTAQRPRAKVARRRVRGPDGYFDIEVGDPADDDATTRWATERAAASRAFLSAKARQAELSAATTSPAAVAALTASENAHAATAVAQGPAAIAASAQHEAETIAALFSANDLAAAKAALDAATKAVADELANRLSQASTSTSLTATVDGLALRGRYRAGLNAQPQNWSLATIPFRATPADAPLDAEMILPAVTADADHPPLAEVLARLDDLVDAIADLITAEGVHHLVNGNTARSGAALDIATTGAVPEHFDVVRTPSAGTTSRTGCSP